MSEEQGGPSLQKRFVKVEFLIEDVHAHSATAVNTGAGKRQSVRGPGSRYDLVKLMRSRGAAAASVTRIVSRHYCILVRLVAAAAICPPQASDTKAASMPGLAVVSYGQECGRIPLRVEQVVRARSCCC